MQIMLIIPAMLLAAPQIHKVRKGDTLYSISKKYDVSVDQLKKMNALASNDLRIGEKLRVK